MKKKRKVWVCGLHMGVFLAFKLHVALTKNNQEKEPLASSPAWVQHKTESLPS